ncbi:DNA ligase D [Chitinophaga pinensis DSM 2588]|uniref:DNA ligase (ATP) n=2 Tax=Chitinophaga pinensis TaxID=79329 RepID=A0A979GUD3_CHIPD|nr:DNA ligase D [Chitinophaga pinensis DSM 2588]
MPDYIEPMLCTPLKTLPPGDEYIYEIKWDGYRAISSVRKKKARIHSRKGLNYSARYPLVAEALAAIGHDCIIDGEIVVPGKDGKPSFNAVQRYNGKRSAIYYYLFDLLWLDGQDLTGLPLTQRQELLRMLIKEGPVLKLSTVYTDGGALFNRMQEQGMEGVVGKKADSAYASGKRGDAWIKVKLSKRQEFVIVGYTEADSPSRFRSLMFGEYLPTGELVYVHHSGGGWSAEEGKALFARLKQLEITKKPFINTAKTETRQHFVKPQLVAEFDLSGFYTPSGTIRHPAPFKGLREDKDAKEVIREEEGDPIISPVEAPGASRATYLNTDSNWKAVDKEQEGAEWMDFTMRKCTIRVHDLERELWTDVPKGKLLVYYNRLSHLILPYIKDRPQSLHLKLTHAGAPRFFIKDMEGRQPECATVFTDTRRTKKAGKRDQIDYLVANNAETLLFMVDTGCIDINPWASRIQQPEYPDYLWLDLDPTSPEKLKGDALIKAENRGFADAIEVARAVKEVLDKHRLKSFVKTSGKTGIHIYIPCEGFGFRQARLLASVLASEVHDLVPEISTVNTNINQRGSRVYIDAGQNDYADTLAAPYCIRPYHQPLVSTPLSWREVNASLDRWAFTVDTIERRLDRKGDLWGDLGDGKVKAANGKVLRRMF